MVLCIDECGERKWLDFPFSHPWISIIQRLSMSSETSKGSIESLRKNPYRRSIGKRLNTPNNNINRLTLVVKSHFYLVKSVGKQEVVSRN
jgi:hypothetical protein